MNNAPIVITGCPRSGTKMMGRVFGTLSKDFCLISEHSNKSSEIPEDQSGVNDQELWWNNFKYAHWSEQFNRPTIDQPIADHVSVRLLRDRYLEIAEGRRLVIKNPSHVLNINIIREMFPEAQFVYCLRDPWTTMHSMTKAGREGFLLRSERVVNEGKSLLHKAAISWNEAVTSLLQSGHEAWHTVRYEEVLLNPRAVIEQMCDSLSLGSLEGFENAVRIPKPSANQQYFYIKNAYRNSPHRVAIEAEIQKGSLALNYPTTPYHLPGTLVEHCVDKVNRKLSKVFSPRDRKTAA
ncbi:Sulfotransferase family protein [Neorhodopirellula lusitana]|uniref:Sulfotransferase family protein n=1 Tax=Neorhodopirellula lusitana TaxID=445327 RepID=A0ABY1PTY5_9BACT|nr:sulfotransferase [Neorhodopirellula lusitana]SMP47763.1 Sulfotransferase family protein [Neorhodopirellula lusitana]